MHLHNQFFYWLCLVRELSLNYELIFKNKSMRLFYFFAHTNSICYIILLVFDFIETFILSNILDLKPFSLRIEPLNGFFSVFRKNALDFNCSQNAQFYIQLVYKPYFGAILLFGQLRAVREKWICLLLLLL